MVLNLGVEIPSTPADGKVNTIWVPSIKNINKPTAARSRRHRPVELCDTGRLVLLSKPGHDQ